MRRIAAAAHKYWADASTDLARDVSATTYNNELLITGIVPNQQMKDAAERLARQIQGVTQASITRSKSGSRRISARTRATITSRTRCAPSCWPIRKCARRTTSSIRSTASSTSWAMRATAPERDLVLSYARNLSNVTQVKSYIQVGNEAESRADGSARPQCAEQRAAAAARDTAGAPRRAAARSRCSRFNEARCRHPDGPDRVHQRPRRLRPSSSRSRRRRAAIASITICRGN